MSATCSRAELGIFRENQFGRAIRSTTAGRLCIKLYSLYQLARWYATCEPLVFEVHAMYDPSMLMLDWPMSKKVGPGFVVLAPAGPDNPTPESGMPVFEATLPNCGPVVATMPKNTVFVAMFVSRSQLIPLSGPKAMLEVDPQVIVPATRLDVVFFSVALVNPAWAVGGTDELNKAMTPAATRRKSAMNVRDFIIVLGLVRPLRLVMTDTGKSCCRQFQVP